MDLNRIADILQIPVAWLFSGRVGKPKLTVIKGGKEAPKQKD